jgi:hypothetical protein
MKKLILSSLVLMSTQAFSQSFLVLNNGVTLTTDKAGLVYDFSLFHTPSTINVSSAQFFIDKEKLYTMNASGNLFEKDLEIKSSKIVAKAGNFMIVDAGLSNNIITIDEAGFYYEFKEKRFNKPQIIGGNFMTFLNEKEKKVEIMTVGALGQYKSVVVQGLNPAEIISAGGRYFTTSTRKIFSVAKDGVISEQTQFATVAQIVKKGGNFFIDSTNTIFTITDEGFIKLPLLPMGLDISKTAKVGFNYLITSEGKLYTINALGEILDRGFTNHDLKQAKITTSF